MACEICTITSWNEQIFAIVKACSVVNMDNEFERTLRRILTLNDHNS